MTILRDTTCDLIEHPDGPQPYAPITMRDTPHGQAMADRLVEANAAIAALLGMGCLIQHLRIEPDVVRVQLTRCPRSGALARHAAHQWWYALGEPDEAMRGLLWRGVFIEWPVHISDVPEIEKEAS